MAHEKVYGVCENKCFVETKSKEQIENDIKASNVDWFEESLRHSVLLVTGAQPLTSASALYAEGVAPYVTGVYPDSHFKYIETHFVTNFFAMFNTCKNLTSVSNLDTHNGTEFRSMFLRCENLTSLCDLDVSNAKTIEHTFEGTFALCSKLTTLTDNPFAPEGSRWQFKDDVSFQNSPLDRTSILKVFNGLQVVENKYISISKTTNGYLSDEDKAIATNKGWTVWVAP